MDTLVIGNEKESSITFSKPERDSNGWLQRYVVHIAMPGMSATATAENPPFGSSPDQFFVELAAAWRGWKGEKRWQAFEGEYELSTTSDALGHVTLSALLRSDSALIAPCWHASVSVALEAGQLERISREAGAFFDHRPN